MDVAIFLEKLILILLVFSITLVVAMYATLAERKVAGFIQDRYGPNRAGPWGILQPVCDGTKLFAKEDFRPDTPNKWLFIAGPGISMVVALLGSAVIPWARAIDFGDFIVIPQVADVNVAVLYVMAVLGISVYGVVLGAWASGNKFSLQGAIRAGAQMISYELAMGGALIAIIMTAGSMSLSTITEQQIGSFGMNWNIIYHPLTFLIFIVCSFAECNRTPFDLAECESELVNGHHTEFSSMKMGFYMFSEYAAMFFSSAFISVLFFGGYCYPGMDWVAENWGTNIDALFGFAAIFGKTLFFMFVYIWVRWTIPRFRYDQLMNLGWKVLFPLSVINIFIIAFVKLIF